MDRVEGWEESRERETGIGKGRRLDGEKRCRRVAERKMWGGEDEG